MEDTIKSIRQILAKINDANENTNNASDDYLTIRDGLVDISFLLSIIDRKQNKVN